MQLSVVLELFLAFELLFHFVLERVNPLFSLFVHFSLHFFEFQGLLQRIFVQVIAVLNYIFKFNKAH